MAYSVESTRTARACQLVGDYVKAHLDPSDIFPEFEIYVVSYTYIVDYWKAMVSTSLPDGMYYEVTYDSFKEQTYVVAYKKFEQHTIPDA